MFILGSKDSISPSEPVCGPENLKQIGPESHDLIILIKTMVIPPGGRWFLLY